MANTNVLELTNKKSKMAQVLELVQEFPDQKAGFFHKRLGFDPGFPLLNLANAGKVIREGKRGNYSYRPSGFTDLDTAEVTGVPVKKRRKAKRKGPTARKLSKAFDVPLDVDVPTDSGTSDLALLGEIIVGVYAALKGRRS